ncbi:Pex24p-domain-containing protein [Xylona heveae TC161]|uniref:Pex24p-domain-containing protein n=1 Tax=Xylona heveae (strain CBS 132557 / TC161) TaxID=1328760 RepID=A0A165HIY9_XYLHT|nr:Pex24p-domain-containing protein [Xylona heveae TC161]KZF23589.1 Pex24p-domain-containing protein [Xylona heveae TC161]
MDEYRAEAFSNRDEPIPVVAGGNGARASDKNTSSQDAPATATTGADDRALDEDTASSTPSNKKSKTRNSLQDRLFSMLMKQIIPSDEIQDDIFETPGRKTPSSSSSYENRPGFSLPLMTSNFRRFNARIGVVFVFQNRVIQLLSWKTPTHTLSFLFVYTFFCLEPTLLATLPIVVVLFFIMVPAFIVRHPPPPIRLPTDAAYSMDGPPLAPPQQVKPASEMSRDFFRNMRDLQNCMEDFSQVHDKTIALVAPRTNFSNEPLSSALFLGLFATASLLFITSHLVPWRTIFLVAGWVGTCLGHPSVQDAIESLRKEDHVVSREKQIQGWLDQWITRDIVLDSAPETREVEIFELQRRDASGASDEWEGWVFSPSPYDPLSPTRISGDRPRGARFFVDVEPPHGWEWSDKKWALDLLSREWVEERMITGVEIETEGERWVYDLDEPTSTSASWASSASPSSHSSSPSSNNNNNNNNGSSKKKNQKKNDRQDDTNHSLSSSASTSSYLTGGPLPSGTTSVNASTTSLSPSIIKNTNPSSHNASTTSVNTTATSASAAPSSNSTNGKHSISSKVSNEKEKLAAKKEQAKEDKKSKKQQKGSKGNGSDAVDFGRGGSGNSNNGSGAAATAATENNRGGTSVPSSLSSSSTTATMNNPHKRGEWRRRRWIRLVKRKPVHHQRRVSVNES